MFEIKTSANFEAAHRLSNYAGKCNRIHGHNWKVELEAKSKKINNQEMVLDFTVLKEILKEFDHFLILKDNKENKKIVNSIPKEWIKWLSFEPTAEQLSKYLSKKIFEKGTLESITIRVWESEKSYAEFTVKHK
ncbi:MAG: 6-carboxytetrahydropterin synthase [Candidatus ainarchaeum sp.]|nr:6-carboxytetrahydropterin synthase [Candidatus ainarchaeum sp.]